MLVRNIFSGNNINVLWFSRHKMTEPQLKALKQKLGENLRITQVDGTMENVHKSFNANINFSWMESDGYKDVEIAPFKEFIQKFDVVAAVLPIGLNQQLLPFMGDKPLITAISNRVATGEVDANGEQIFKFDFAGWKRILKVEIVMEDFI
jgi:hypothetical protein